MDAVLERTEIDQNEAKRIDEEVNALDLTDQESLKVWMDENIKWFPSGYENLKHEDGTPLSREEKLGKLFKEQTGIIDQNTIPEEFKNQNSDNPDEPKKEYLTSDYEGHMRYNLKTWATPKPSEE